MQKNLLTSAFVCFKNFGCGSIVNVIYRLYVSAFLLRWLFQVIKLFSFPFFFLKKIKISPFRFHNNQPFLWRILTSVLSRYFDVHFRVLNDQKFNSIFKIYYTHTRFHRRYIKFLWFGNQKRFVNLRERWRSKFSNR